MGSRSTNCCRKRLILGIYVRGTAVTVSKSSRDKTLMKLLLFIISIFFYFLCTVDLNKHLRRQEFNSSIHLRVQSGKTAHEKKNNPPQLCFS